MEDTMENIALEVKNVVKQVREKIIINDISFNVKKEKYLAY
ncbi:hypothetical protein MGA3_11680 [Bacillus methanolicus MGA3]|nr:hypothetical protein MGA3_11680 [Bacillus methanolicus MGA3]